MVVEGEERRFSWQSLLEVGKNDLPSTGPQRPTSTASVYSHSSFRAATESRVGLPYGSWKDCDRSVIRSHRVWGSAESFHGRAVALLLLLLLLLLCPVSLRLQGHEHNFLLGARHDLARVSISFPATHQSGGKGPCLFQHPTAKKFTSRVADDGRI